MGTPFKNIIFAHNETSSVRRELVRIISAISAGILDIVTPEAILLSGSWGRGEGTVREENGHVKILSDFEIITVTKLLKYRGEIASLAERLSDELGVEINIAVVHPKRFLNNQIRNLSFGFGRPTIVMYEIKTASKVLYGNKNLLKLNPIKPEQIPIWEGLRLLLNRLIEGAYYREKSFEEQYRRFLAKIIISCGDAALIMMGKYHFSYEKRWKILQNLIDNRGPLAFMMDFIDIIQRAYDFKLLGLKGEFDSKKINLLVDLTLREILKRGYRMQFESYIDFQTRFKAHPWIRKDCVNYRIGKKGYPIYDNLINWSKLMKSKNKPGFRLLKNALSIPMTALVYASVPLVYFYPFHREKRYVEAVNTDLALLEGQKEFIGDWEKVVEGLYTWWLRLCVGKNHA